MIISACIVIRNEAKVLERCLMSIKDLVDEIIVVHDGPCLDKSLDIARKYKANIFIRPYIGEAEYHRLFSYEKTQGDWILQIDADEVIEDEARGKILNLIESKTADAFSFRWPYPSNDGYLTRGPFSQTYKPCLFRKNKMFMLGISHEYPRTYGSLEKRKEIQLVHKPLYDNFTLDYFSRKWIDWAKLQAKQIYNLEKAPKFNMNNSNKVYKYYENLRAHPVISGINESLRFLLIFISRGILWAGVRSLKIAFFELAYLWLVRKNLWLLKHGQRI